MEMSVKTGWMLCALAVAPAAASAAPPDLSGMWATPFRVHSSGYPLMGGTTPWLAVSKGDPASQPVMSLDEMSVLVDRSVREHHGNPMFGMPMPPPPPFNAKGAAVYGKIDPKAMQALEVGCYPTNAVWRIGFGSTQIVQGQTTIAVISDGGLARTIYLDGRSEADALPQWNGHSVGHWDGATLKVTVTGLRGDVLNMANWPMTEHATIQEEYRLADGGRRLTLRETLFDPTYYTEPMRRMVYFDRRPASDEVLDYTCEEGKADMIEMQAKQ